MTVPGKDVRIRVAGILVGDRGLLLVAHKKNDEIYWLLPGGGVDYGESLTEALEREFFEELNVKIKTGSLALISDSIDPSGSRHVVNICFFCSYVEGNYILGCDGRLFDYHFFQRGELSNVKMYPPINRELESLFTGSERAVYIGKLWK